MAERTFTFDDWRGGEYGELGEANAPPNSFTSNECLVYRSGLIGPRPGTKYLAPTGLPGGTVWGVIGVEDKIVFGVADKVYGFTAPNGAVAQIGANLNSTPTAGQFIRNGPDKVILASLDDTAYAIDPGANTCTALTSAPGTRAIAQYGVRLMAASTTANPRRIYYSAAADYTSWPALNFFDVLASGGFPITHLEEIRQRLAIANEGGEWWALTGTPGVNDVLRRQSRGDVAPPTPHHAARVGETLWFLPSGDNFPVQYSGITVDKLRHRHLSLPQESTFGHDYGDYAAASLPQAETVVFAHPEFFWSVFHNGVWHRISMSGGSSNLTATTLVGPSAEADSDTPFVFCNNGVFEAWQPTLDRPARVSDTWAGPGDLGDLSGLHVPMQGAFLTREQWSERGEDLVVRTVIVDFETFDTECEPSVLFDGNNELGVTVSALHRYGAIESYGGETQYWRAPTSEGAAAGNGTRGTALRHVFRVGDQGPGQGFRLLVGMRGVAVKKVTVIAESEDRR